MFLASSKNYKWTMTNATEIQKIILIKKQQTRSFIICIKYHLTDSWLFISVFRWLPSIVGPLVRVCWAIFERSYWNNRFVIIKRERRLILPLTLVLLFVNIYKKSYFKALICATQIYVSRFQFKSGDLYG